MEYPGKRVWTRAWMNGANHFREEDLKGKIKAL
jgi:hypothetical protein